MKELKPDQTKALEKLHKELKKDVNVAIEISKKGYFLELIYFIYNLKSMRIHSIQAKDLSESSSFIDNSFNLIEETIKYAIQLLAKHASPDFVLEAKTEYPIVNFRLVDVLNKQCKMINSKYESESMIQLFDVELLDEDAKQLKINMDNIKEDKDAQKLFNYFLRIDRDNDIKKKNKQFRSDLIENFKKEYAPVRDLFEQAYGISVDEFCDFVNWLLDRSISEIEKAKNSFEYLDNGNVKDQSIQTMIAHIPSFLITIDEMNKQFPGKYSNVIEALTFNEEVYDECQLRFHLITRSPLIKIENFYIVSPELLLDSMFTNTHYSLLESSEVSETYKAIQANLFIDKLTSICGQYGYSEVERELDLYEGKKQLGDIDLILKDENNNFLLIEAKNHALAMDIYFKDVKKTKEHLDSLKQKWEKKVKKRVDFLKSHHEKYNIPATYQYIIVSRYPEIISHYTDLLVLSMAEFEHWLSKNRWSSNFEEITNNFYNMHGTTYSEEELTELSKSGLISVKFSKE